MTDKLLGLLGLAYRGRRIDIGTEPVLRAVQGGKAALVLLASDAGESITRQLSVTAKVPVLRSSYDKQTLGSAFGRGTCAVLAVCDGRLASEISARLESDNSMEVALFGKHS